MVVDTTKSCKPSILCDIPLVRGDCVDIPLVRGDCGSCDWYPLSEEVIMVVWLSAHPSKCKGDLCCALPLVWRLYCLREELCTPNCITQILSGGSLCGKSCVDD